MMDGQLDTIWLSVYWYNKKKKKKKKGKTKCFIKTERETSVPLRLGFCINAVITIISYKKKTVYQQISNNNALIYKNTGGRFIISAHPKLINKNLL